MKRSGILLGSVLMGSILVGCDGGGIPAGAPPEAPKSSQTSEFRDMMEKAGGKMTKGQGGKKAAAAKVAPAPANAEPAKPAP